MLPVMFLPTPPKLCMSLPGLVPSCWEGGREEGREGGREGAREGGREGGSEGGGEGGGRREGAREEGREGGREGGRRGGRKRGRKGGREGITNQSADKYGKQLYNTLTTHSQRTMVDRCNGEENSL